MDAGLRGFFAERIDQLADRLYGTALRLARNSDDAEDLVAETVAKAWAKLGELSDPRSFDAWIMRILANTFVSEWRHRRASPEVAMEAAPEEGEDEPFSLYEKLHQPFLLWWTTPEEEVIAKLLREDMDRALDALPDAFRIAIVLVDIEGYRYGEAAELLGVPVGTVRSRLARGRALLQRSLWRHARDAGLLERRASAKANDG
ncbi:MAG TPA: sigma-70 family RNA polymerase sigma factor [Burkholderiales bacterium]|nr:sigma-70 family RNA polymerase sigma factor [Burkholderiales bacterium]